MHAHGVRVRVSKDRQVRVTLPSDFPLESRLTRPPGVGPVTLEDMERAIGKVAAQS